MITLRYIVLLPFLSLGGNHLILACSCLPLETFCDEIDRAKANDFQQLVVVRGTITEEIFVNEQRTDRTFVIAESFINPQGVESFRVKEGNGADCGRFLGKDYQIGDELIVIVYLWNDTTPLTQFSTCSAAPLRVDGLQVTGHITKHQEQTMTLSAFRKLKSCQLSSIRVSIFPNPTSQRLNIQKEGHLDRSSFLEIEAFDLLGRRVYRHELSKEEQQRSYFEIDIQEWPEGSYLLALKNDEEIISKPVAVTRH